MFQKYCIFLLVLFNFLTNALAADDTKLHIEKIINSSIDTSAQPCENFHAYACGNFNDNLFSNSTKKSKNIFQLTNLQYNLAIYNLLETYDQQERQIAEHCQSFVEMVRKYYNTCRTISVRNLTKYLEEIKPGPTLNWPLFEELNNDSNQTSQWPHNKDFDLFSLMGKLESYGLSDTFMRYKLNCYNAGKANLTIEPILIYKVKKTVFDKLGKMTTKSTDGFKAINRRFFNATHKNNETQKEDINFFFGETVTYKGLSGKLMQEFEATHRKFNNILNNKTKDQNEVIEITFEDLVKDYPNLNFKSYFNESLGKALPLETIILLKHPAFFQHLNDNLWSEFQKQELCNFLMLKFLSYIEIDVKPMNCVEELIEKFDLAVNFLYYQHIFATQAQAVKSDVKEIFESVVDMMRKYFKSNDLKLTKFQIELLMEKLKNSHLYLGNLPENVSCEKVKEFYSSMPALDVNNFYKNHLIMFQFFHRLDQYENESYHIPDTKIDYEDKYKRFNVPFSLLTPPFYDITYNNFSKYSLLGFFFAQKLTRIFYFVRLNNYDTGEVSQQLENYINCSKSELGVNRHNERVANYIATDVVRKIVTLKILNLMPMEILPFWKKYFYLYVAQEFCVTNKYSYRIDNLNWIMQNSESFAQIFSCPKESKMNPDEKCYPF